MSCGGDVTRSGWVSSSGARSCERFQINLPGPAGPHWREGHDEHDVIRREHAVRERGTDRRDAGCARVFLPNRVSTTRKNEHDACGVGFIAHMKGVKSHQIVKDGLFIWKTSPIAAPLAPIR